jgi:hypothetical protein
MNETIDDDFENWLVNMDAALERFMQPYPCNASAAVRFFREVARSVGSMDSRQI